MFMVTLVWIVHSILRVENLEKGTPSKQRNDHLDKGHMGIKGMKSWQKIWGDITVTSIDPLRVEKRQSPKKKVENKLLILEACPTKTSSVVLEIKDMVNPRVSTPHAKLI